MRVSSGRQTQDAQFSHMASTDNENPLAYLDYKQLLMLIGENWQQFASALIHRSAWDGRQEELLRVRHRIGHMRRPHPDDLSRIEQTLRDLERGAFIACASYNRQSMPDMATSGDAVTAGWLRQEHPAARLIEHASRRYDTELVIRTSRRPWAELSADLTHAPGILWHVGFFMRNRRIDVCDLWNDSSFVPARLLAVHLVADDPSHVSLTFAAADHDRAVADAIGAALEAVLAVSRHGLIEDSEEQRWQRRAARTDYRVVCSASWNIVSESTIPISMFGAGGGVTAPVSW